ncbi:hypothetical protein AVEN_191881-1 [Araneus ventricosus]|uniref:Uncharacterized protein n=1 Tax=Araneus ventricosus TaxID=182803 RepID=A0A4Y2J9V0_ARAVE|nr:hypothetical protein AVEN_191881-1 [Araneus ventricosus]
MEAPCKRHSRSLQSPRATSPISPKCFQNEIPRPAFPIELHSPSPIILCESLDSPRLCERSWLPPYPRSYFSFIAQRAEWKTGQDENPNISITPRQFSSEFEIDNRLWSDALQMVRIGAFVNVQFKSHQRPRPDPSCRRYVPSS